MASRVKTPPPKIFCLYHQQINCVCITPVTDENFLKKRLAGQIKLNSILNKFEPDEELKTERNDASAVLQTRLDELQNS